MAPSRRKRAKNAEASRKWNVGELVLAKVKGYPPWPATVSKPEDRGYPTGLKKVLVCFFGTKDIALCNPADLEEFTEEKKITLLGKQIRKGPFLCALNEIIDCFDKLKKQDQVSDNELFGKTDAPVENVSGDSSTKSVKDEAVPISVEQLSAGVTDCLESIIENVVAAPVGDALHNEVMQLEEAHADLSSTERHVYPARSKADTTESGCFFRKRRTYRVSREDTNSCDKGSTVDLGCESVEGKLFDECSESQSELSGRLEFQTNCIAIRKNRKADQQTHMRDTSFVEVRADLVVSEDEMPQRDSVFHHEIATLRRCSQQDGDEHSPLAKRARIRMGSHAVDEVGASVCEGGKLVEVDSTNTPSDGALDCELANKESIERNLCRTSPAKHEVETLVHEQEEPKVDEGLKISGPLNCNVDALVDETSNTKMDHGDPSISKIPVRKPHSVVYIQQGFTDGESSVPLSERDHRALEAMSANLCEADEEALSCSPCVNDHGDMCLSNCSVECSEMPVRNEATMKLGLEPTQDDSTGDCQESSYEYCDGLNMEPFVHKQETSCLANCANPDICEVSRENVENTKNKCVISSPLSKRPAESDEDQHLRPESPQKLAHLGGTTICPISTDNSWVIIHTQEAGGESDPNLSLTNSDSILVEETAADSLNVDKCTSIDILNSAVSETNKMKQLLSHENDLDSQRSEFKKEAAWPASPDSDVVPSETTLTLSTTNDCRPSCASNSISDNSLADRQDSNALVSPPSSLVSSSKVESLSSFEDIVRSLTRSKETIGRATRIAIDCAKVGFASKAVEILVHRLESESRLHKKVDLFFLVDSIAQCSRCLKGDCGIYPTLFQPMLACLLAAAAPPCLSSCENQRQCLKVLKVWLERKILPEPVIRHHIEELDAFHDLYHSGGSPRPFRNERAFDDPVREMEGILVDEYGSNLSIQFPGFRMPPMLSDADEESDSDGDGFEAVTSEHNAENLDGGETTPTKVGKRNHIIEDVDREREMADVAPCSGFRFTSRRDNAGTGRNQMSLHLSDNHYELPFTSQQFEAAPPSSHQAPLSDFSHAAHKYENYKRNPKESRWEQSDFPRINTRTSDKVYHYTHENQDFEQEPRHFPDTRRDCSYSDKPAVDFCDRASNGLQVDGNFHRGDHIPHSHRTPSHQHTPEHRSQLRRDIPPHQNRFRTRYTGNSSFYRDFETNRYAPPQSGTGEYWGPPSPSTSGHCYDNGSRMDPAPCPPSNKPALPSNRRRIPPWLMNRMQANPCKQSLGGPLPVGNRGPNNWKSR